ncbi:MAG: YqgE/AlgH family protein [Proteobacteria bacterium]|nr:YqgE/AlgH family protein [Pseudomonadota bacterium]
MDKKTKTPHLDGKLLIAMPGMGDPRFDKSLIYMCAHSEDGAMGLIINKPAEDLQFSDLLEQLKITPAQSYRPIEIHFGGPVEHGRGFVLHSKDYIAEDSTLEVNDEFGMTATLDILEDISQGNGPDACLLALGYAGWGPGQLEDEIRANGWLICDADATLIFSPNNQDKWHEAIESIGIDPRLLSATGGSA